MQPIPFAMTGGSTSITVTNTLTTLGTVQTLGRGYILDITVTNTGATALNNFSLAIQDADNGVYSTRLQGTDFGTATTTLLNSSGGSSGSAMNAIPANGTGWFQMLCGGANAIQLSASVVGINATTVVVSGGASAQAVG